MILSRLRRTFAKLNSLFHNKRIEEELAREVASHLTLLVDDFERRGLCDALFRKQQALGLPTVE